MTFIRDLTVAYEATADPANAEAMAKYMKNHFRFLGLKTELRRSRLKEALAINTVEVAANAREIGIKLYKMPEREYHYSAIEVLIKQLPKEFREVDIELIEYLLVTNSWWDSVDTISKYLLGGYLRHYPGNTENVIGKFSDSGNMWLNRSAIIFQLGYKKDTNEELLFGECEKHKTSREFFIQKAIGWALREYAKINPEAVVAFVASAGLKPLSTREALKNL